MTSLTLLQLNDLHGYAAAHPELFRLGVDRTFRSGGGLARIATIFRRVRRETDGAAVALDNSDTFHGSMEAARTHGEALIAPMGRLGLDGMTLHWDFAYGLKRVRESEKRIPYPILAANRESAAGGLMCPPFTVFDRGGVKAGIIGLAAVIAPQLLPVEDRQAVRLTIGDVELPKRVPVLGRDNGVQPVVVLSHLSFPQDCKLARVVSGIGVLLSGHTHHRLESPVVVNDAIIMQSGERLALWCPDSCRPLTESGLWNIVPANPPLSLVTLRGSELRQLFEENLVATFACDPRQQRGGYVKCCCGIELAIKLETRRAIGYRIRDRRRTPSRGVRLPGRCSGGTGHARRLWLGSALDRQDDCGCLARAPEASRLGGVRAHPRVDARVTCRQEQCDE